MLFVMLAFSQHFTCLSVDFDSLKHHDDDDDDDDDDDVDDDDEDDGDDDDDDCYDNDDTPCKPSYSSLRQKLYFGPLSNNFHLVSLNLNFSFVK